MDAQGARRCAANHADRLCEWLAQFTEPAESTVDRAVARDRRDWIGVCPAGLTAMPTTTYTHPLPATWNDLSEARADFARAKAVFQAVVVVVAAMLALTFRVSSLSTYGLSEDEINKVHAIEQYRAGNFAANAEHPMLMKLAMWGSVSLSESWNRIARPAAAIPIETAIRLPNAIAGAATTLVMFGVADLLFGGAVGAVAATIWAFDVNAIAINRIGKEDTFLLLCFLLAVFCYERAKRIGSYDIPAAQRWYTLSGAAFGLMLASKYMPQYLGIYALFNMLTDLEPGENKPRLLQYYGAMAAAFLAANPAILTSAVWRYVPSYVQGDMLAHHGYLYGGALYVTNIPVSPLGVPPTFYLRLLATRVPLVLLAALVPGVIEMVRRRTERGYVLLRVLALFLLVPYSLMAAKFLRYALPMLATVDLVAAVGFVAGIGWLLRKRWLSIATRRTVAAFAVAVFFVGLVAAQQSAAPFYSLFQNGVGTRVDPRGAAFPEQTYDYGVREATAAIASVASPSAVVVSDAPAVAAEYLQREGRRDIVVRSLSADGVATGVSETWVLVQDEHVTFENQLLIDWLRATRRPWKELRMDDVVALQVFRISGR